MTFWPKLFLIEEPLDEVTEENKKAGLKLNIKITKIMAHGPITSWQIDREKVEAETGFIFLGSKTTWAPNQTVTASMKLKDACSLKEKL